MPGKSSAVNALLGDTPYLKPAAGNRGEVVCEQGDSPIGLRDIALAPVRRQKTTFSARLISSSNEIMVSSSGTRGTSVIIARRTIASFVKGTVFIAFTMS